MDEWQIVQEDGQEYYINEKYGNILKLEDGTYLALIPKAISFGKFKNLEDAKNILESQNIRDELSKYLNLFNQKLLLKEIK